MGCNGSIPICGVYCNFKANILYELYGLLPQVAGLAFGMGCGLKGEELLLAIACFGNRLLVA